MIELLEENNAVLSRTNFEIKTTAKIERRRRDNLKGKMREEMEVDLYKRRAAVSELFNGEMAMWGKECMGQEETLEMRKARYVCV